MLNKKKRWISLILTILILSPFVFSDSIQIKNLGVIGFNETNQEYTSLRTVILGTNYSINSTACRYRNNDTASWTSFESCTLEKYWLLSDDGGLKRVFVNINYSNGTNSTYNDTIYYNYTGAGLDTSAPSGVTITDGDYSNSNSTISVSWSEASDPESDILAIPLLYSYQILINGTAITSWTAFSTARSFGYSTSLTHGDNVSVQVNASNSANLQSITVSDGLIIDLITPNNTQISSNINESQWNSSSSAFFNWSSSDGLSGVGGYSYTLSTDSSVSPDDVPEGPSGDLENHKNKTFTSLYTGKYKFKIKAEDKAENWGDITLYNLWIDRTSPSKPEMTGAAQVYSGTALNYSWTSSYDEHSGIGNYTLQIANTSDFNISEYFNETTLGNTTFSYEFTPTETHSVFYARVRAVDAVGNTGQWSSEQTQYDTAAPNIIILTPDTNVDDANLPIIVVNTDEQATCYYNISSGFALFEFTNSTYHETKPRSKDSGGYTINCTDSSGNSGVAATGGLTFLGGSASINNVSSVQQYTGQIAYINVSVDRGGLQRNRFNVYLDGLEKDFTIVDDGNGDYIVNLIAPEESGTYTINITLDGSYNSDTLTVNPLNLVSTYSDSFTASKNLRITYYTTSNYTAGFASDSNTVTLGSVNNKLNITSTYDGKVYFFATSTLQNINRKEEHMKQKTFLLLKKPSFGYASTEFNILHNILSYPSIDLIGNETIRTGSHNILLKSLSGGTSKRVLITTKISNYNEIGVIQYD